MVYVTGDTHGEQARMSAERFSWLSELTADDCLIICGDFGYLFENNQREQSFLDSMQSFAFEILFLDGNHENFPAISAYREELWNGGRTHRIRRNVRHLMRGQVFELEGSRIFTMGGGYSADKALRIPGETWWEQELPTNNDYAEAQRNLEKCGGAVDFILTHAAPLNTLTRFAIPDPHELPLNNYLEWLRETTPYTRWYFGHMHRDEVFGCGQYALWHKVRDLKTGQICAEF